MVVRIQALMCLTVLFSALIDARWHNFKALRNHRLRDESSGEDLAARLLSENPEDYPEERLESDDRQFVRHRRHHSISSSEAVGNVDGQDDLAKDRQRAKAIDENEELYDDLKEQQRDSWYRFISHRATDRAVSNLLHHHQQHRFEKHRKPLDYVDPLMLAKENDQDSMDIKDLLRRGKRHNRRRTWTEKDKMSFNRSRQNPSQFENEKSYEVEVREAQNSSLCNYTVIPIADPGGRIPHELEHIKCNHVGSKCQDKGTYCCIQTYRNVEVMYESGKKETLKVYSGCVCSLQIYGTLEPYTPDVDIDN